MKKIILPVFIILSMFLLISCNNDVIDSGSEENMENIDNENEEKDIENSNKEEGERDMSVVSVIDDINEDMMAFAEQNKMYAGAIHYEESMYLINIGEMPTGGYEVYIQDVEILSNDDLNIVYSYISPDIDAMVTQAITYPHIFIEIHEEYQESDINFSIGE